MSKKLIPDYKPPRHSPRLTLARVSGWACLNADGSFPWLKVMPHSKGRIMHNTTNGKFARLPWKGPTQWVKDPYKLIRQFWKIIQFQIARIDTVQNAQALLRSTRSEIIRMVKSTSPEDVKAWQKILKSVHDSLLPIGHDSVEQMRVRLETMFGEPNFEDSTGRPLESGPTQAKMSAADRRGDEAVEDFEGIKFAMMYYFAVVQEFILEIEQQIDLMEMDLMAIEKKAFRGKKRYAQMRDTQATRYYINNALDVITEYMWCAPFVHFREGLLVHAEALVRLCDNDADDFDTALWQQVQDKARQMLTNLRILKTRIDLEHLRQALAESGVEGVMKPEVDFRIGQITNRYLDYPDEMPRNLSFLIGQIVGLWADDKSKENSISVCYELVGNFLDPKPPAAHDEATQAATTT